MNRRGFLASLAGLALSPMFPIPAQAYAPALKLEIGQPLTFGITKVEWQTLDRTVIFTVRQILKR